MRTYLESSQSSDQSLDYRHEQLHPVDHIVISLTLPVDLIVFFLASSLTIILVSQSSCAACKVHVEMLDPAIDEMPLTNYLLLSMQLVNLY